MKDLTIPTRKSLAQTPLDEIRELYDEIMAAFMAVARTKLDKAIRLGELLTQQKASLKHGEWLPWIEQNLPFDRATAANYMRVYDRREELKCKTVLHLTDAYKLLAPPPAEPPPIPARQNTLPALKLSEAVELASVVACVLQKQNRQMSANEALALVLEFTQPGERLEFDSAGRVVL